MKLLCGASLAAVATGVAAAPSSAAAEAAKPTEIGEVVVTAQRREESLQRVPVAVTAITATAIEKTNTVSTIDLPAIAPGLTITQSSSASQPFIRGVGAQAVSVGYEGSVATYVDGVYIASLISSIFSFNNVERVEVLRGPQGTLFGRNTTGGLIQVITRKPTPEPTADVSVTAENYSTFSGAFYGSTRLTDHVTANLAVFAHEQGKGYGKNLFLNEDINYNNEYAGRAEIQIDPSEKVSVLLSADYDHSDNDLGVNRALFQDALGIGRAHRTGSPQDSTYGVARHVPEWQWGISQNASLNMGWATLRSITALRKWHLNANYDQDTLPILVVSVFQNYYTRTFQQEFLLQGDTGSLNWTVGAFYFNSSAQLAPNLTVGPPGSPVNFARYGIEDLDSYAAYAQGTYGLTDKLNLTAGFRYTTDRRILNASFVAAPGHPAGAGAILATAIDKHQNISKPTWKVGADYRVSDDVMVYGSVSRSFKTGGYNLNAITNPPVNPEILTAEEAGFKAELLEHRLRFNGSFFNYDYKDIQLSQVQGASIIVLNAAHAKMHGAEFEVTAVPPVPAGRLEVRANLALLHAKYTSFPGAPINLPNPVTSVPAGVVCPATRPATAGGNLACVGDATGFQMIRSPKWTVGASLDYAIPVSGGEVDVSANYFHSDGFFWEPSNRTRQAPYDLVNAQVSYAPENARWRIRVFGRNLTNQLYYSSVSEQGLGDLATAQPPRTYGVGLDLKFGAH